MIMLIVAADLGSYSVKFIVSKVERKEVTHLSITEEVINYEDLEELSDNPLWEIQFEIIHKFLEQLPEEFKLIINAPNDLFTDRFTTVPIGNRKKATLMIPFSLEEELPFSISETHMSMSLECHKTSTDAIVSITKKQDFDPFYDLMLRNQIRPKVLTTELSLYENFVNNCTVPFGNAFCILDIGHSSTKAYFFYNRKLVSTHKSFIAGNTITESIAQNYDNDLAQAKIYKHQSSFFLTESQLEQFEEDQVKFANLMHQTISPLINEIKRWELGFRISHGITVGEIYLTGGTSNIKNINNYLEEQLSTKISFLNTYENMDISQIESDEKYLRKFTTSNLEVSGYLKKSKLMNLLSGEYLIPGEMDLPLHSFFFISTRLATITALLVVGMIINGVYLNSDIKNANKIIEGLVKNSTLELTARQGRLAKSQKLNEVQSVHTKLQSKTKMIKQEVKSLQSALEVNALSPLFKLKEVIAGPDFEIIDFSGSSMGDFSAIIKGKDIEKIKELQQTLNRSSFNDLFIDLNEKLLTLTINASI